ncbi:MAG: transaldolase, partial [Myxococcota bacterium]
LGAWLEQLLAESTGKQGTGVVPIDGEALLEPEHYGSDRVFVSLCLKETPTFHVKQKQLQQLQQAGHPVIHLNLPTKESVVQQFVLWEIATAVLGSVLQIHPFNQPDVEASKKRSQTLMQQYEQTGALVDPPWSLQEGSLKVLAQDPQTTQTDSLQQLLNDHINLLQEGDYFALLAFLPRSDACETALQRIRQQVQQAKRVATTLGFGPRFLHSIGQLYKGGPRQGVFVYLTCDDTCQLAAIDRPYNFNVVKEAQLRGDFTVMAEQGQRVLRVHLGKDLSKSLKELEQVFQ